MGTAFGLALWSILLALSAWRPEAIRRRGWWLVPAVAAAVWWLSPWWRLALIGEASGEASGEAWGGLTDGSGGAAPPFAAPSAAFASVWALALLAIARRRLDGAALCSGLRAALIAAAALGLALDSVRLAALGGAGPAALLAAASGPWLAGLALCLLAEPRTFPWDYPAWFAGVLTLTPAAAPLLALPLPLALALGGTRSDRQGGSRAAAREKV